MALRPLHYRTEQGSCRDH